MITAMASTMTSIVLGGAAVAAYATLHRNSTIFGPVLSRLPDGGRGIALTFDDGPTPEATPRLLDLLAATGVSATFFLLGRHVERWPAIARRVHDEGHLVANHGYAHERLHFAGARAARADIERGSDAIAAATGVRPAHFRPPHGSRSPFVTPAAASLGERTVGWTYAARDWERPGADVIARRVVARARPGAIVLLHDGDAYDPRGDRSQTVAAVALLVPALRDLGFTFALLPR